MKKKGHKGVSRSKLFSSVTKPKEGRKRAERAVAGRGRPTLVTQQPAPRLSLVEGRHPGPSGVVQERRAFSCGAFGGPLSIPTPHASASNWGLGRRPRKAPIGCQDTFPSDPESPRLTAQRGESSSEGMTRPNEKRQSEGKG